MANADDEPMWATNRVVAPIHGPAITIPKTANEFAIKGNHLTLVKGNNSSDTDKIIARMDVMALKMETRNTQPKPRGSSSKPFQPPLARNEHVNVVFTRSGRSYNPPTNSYDSHNQNDSHIPIDLNSDDEDDEPTPQPATPKLTKEALIPKPYKPRIPYSQRLKKEKMEAQYGKFLNIIRAVQINIPFVDVLTGMPKYGKFLKELVSNKHKLEQISLAFLNDECSTIIQNKVSPKLKDPGSFLIPFTFSKTFSCNALH
ncbi:hypothetical protein Tco_1114832 [Tanacetum coccineum]